MLLHSTLISLLGSFSYPSNKHGMCYGISMMGIQAFLARDMQTFIERLDLLTVNKDEKVLKENYNKARTKQQEWYAQKKLELQKKVIKQLLKNYY